MKIVIAAVGTRVPAWVTQAWDNYVSRLPRDCQIDLRTVRAEPRVGNKNTDQLMAAEAQRLTATIPKNAHPYTIALDEHGKDLTTAELHDHMTHWRDSSQDAVFFIGGPDGLDTQLKQSAHARWRLSSMTLPHPMVRILLAEQL